MRAQRNTEREQADEGKLTAFIGQMLSDLGDASSVAMVRTGEVLGLYETLRLVMASDDQCGMSCSTQVFRPHREKVLYYVATLREGRQSPRTCGVD